MGLRAIAAAAQADFSELINGKTPNFTPPAVSSAARAEKQNLPQIAATHHDLILAHNFPARHGPVALGKYVNPNLAKKAKH
jgi:hypothetical protein